MIIIVFTAENRRRSDLYWNSSDYAAANDGMISELNGKHGEGSGRGQFKEVLSRHLLGRTEENYENAQ
jgi:hypothetical protein